jgi:dienelactone hydrolase
VASIDLNVGASQYRTLNDRVTTRAYASLAEWERRAAYLRERILASAGLLPPPDKTPLRSHVFDEKRHDDYSVFKVSFESLPGFYVTGNLYRPAGAGPFPAILSPHGHWAYGRLENTPIASVPGRAINLAQQGFVVFSYDMIGYNDSRQVPHTPGHTGHPRAFGGRRENLWGLSLAGLQLWNSIRSVDFLESLPDVDRDRIGCTGASGGGTQTFLLAAVDERIKVAAPVNMISLHMQGGCLCENEPGLRLDTNNVELAAAMAPRPLLMVSTTGDWTKETPEVEYPAMRSIYALFGAESRVQTVQFDAPHNYNRDSREAVYSWMARWLKNAPGDVRVVERTFRPDPVPDLLVFYGRPLPDDAVTPDQLTERWIASARRQIHFADPKILQSALLQALALERRRTYAAGAASSRSKIVVLASESRETQSRLARAGFSVRPVSATPFDAEAAAKISHFETYNRTAAGQRVADLVQALDANPGAMLVADREWALPALLALAVVSVSRAVIDVAQFDDSSDDAFVERLYIPGIRRAGDLQTAISMATGTVVIHNTGGRLTLEGARIEPRQLSAEDIVARLKG